jgi:exonuclease SbcD
LRILHFADLHLGVENYGHIDPTTGLPTRLLDILAALDETVDYALANNVDLVLFCGDAYKSREPSQTHQREFAKRISRLSEAGVPTFLLVGNHDLPNAAGRATSTEIFSTLSVKNVFVSSRPDIYHIPTRNGDIQVASLPWLRRSALLSKEDTRNLNFKQINERMQQALINIINAHASRLDPGLPSVLAAHVWVMGATLGTEKTMSIGQEHALPVSSVANRAFDYIALGHIHKGQVLSNNPAVVYAGSLQRLDFGDENNEKGFYVVDINQEVNKRHVSCEFHPVKGRRFVTIAVALQAGDTNPTGTVLQAIGEHKSDVRDAIVRIQLTLPSELEGLLNDTEIRNALNEVHYATVARDVKRETRLRLGKWSAEEVTPLDALKLYLESKKTAPEQADVLLEYGKRLIDGDTNPD